MKITSFVVMLTVGILPLSSCAQETNQVSMRVSSSAKDIDVYLVNGGFDDKAVSIVHGFHEADLGRGLRLKFYDASGKCVTCELSGGRSVDQSSAGIRTKGWREIALFPNQIVGKSIPLEIISEIYGIGDGCYGFYAEGDGEISVDGKRREIRLVSNSGKVCIGPQ